MGPPVARYGAEKEEIRMKITPESTVTVSCKCAECKGVGVIPNPIWVEFNREVKEGRTSADQMEPWFISKGAAEKQTSMGSTYWRLPPYEIPCGECEGSGVTCAEITLREIASFVRTSS